MAILGPSAVAVFVNKIHDNFTLSYRFLFFIFTNFCQRSVLQCLNKVIN